MNIRPLLLLLGVASAFPWSTLADGIISATRTGTLKWTTPFSNSSSTLLSSTNLSNWLPAQHLYVTGAVGSVALSQPLPPRVFFRIQNDDVAAVPANMALVPGGPFQMGDSYAESFANALPVHAVNVSAFLIDKVEVSNEDMRRTLQWAYDHNLIGGDSTSITNKEGDSRELMTLDGFDNGYPYTHITFTNGVFSVRNGRENFPASGVTWYGAMAYCNYRSDMEGLERCISFTNRINTFFSDWTCDFTKSGYRLPTEAEWEKAARGGLTGHHFPWPSLGGTYGQFFHPAFANFSDSGDPYEPGTTPVGYYNGAQVIFGTPPVRDMANGYGLYDMAGNVWEWVWDYYQENWYSQPGAVMDDTRGPAGPFTNGQWLFGRVIRGGSQGYYAGYWLTPACRHVIGFGPDYANFVVGFRPARRQ